MSSLSVGSPIGAGAYGSVYHARWQGRKVAIKQFTMTLADAARESAIQQEVRLLDSLRDKHIIQFYGTTEYEGRLVLVMEFAEGGSLEGVIRDGQLDWPAKTRIAQEVVRGLTYIHHMNVLHRDLKSMNVLLTRHMEVKLCDFGLATVKVHATSKSTVSSKGTLRWMAPELFAARPKYSTKSDMFAFAVVMWELAANCTIPFREQIDSLMVVSLVKGGEREELPDDTPADYRQWVERCWDQDPAKRPEAEEMVIEDLSALLVKSSSDLQGCGTTVDITMSFSDISLQSPSSSSSSSSMTSPLPPPLPSRNRTRETPGTIAQPMDEMGAILARADAGDVEAQMTVAAKYETGVGVDQNDVEAFKWYQRAAEHDSSHAQFKTGQFSKSGRGTPQNDANAVYWWILAADSGHRLSQNELGRMYQEGVGVTRNASLALSWFRKSADQGCAEAQFHLAEMYMNGGKGSVVAQDDGQAMMWYRKAADQGHPEAQLTLGRMYENGRGGAKKDFTVALTWYRKSADQGSAAAQNNLGRMYEKGHGVKANPGLAFEWYQKAAEKGNLSAQNNLACMYQNGAGVKKDQDLAFSWFRKAADQGDSAAQGNLGSMYFHGHGVTRDHSQALAWFTKSANKGYAPAQFNLGWMYDNGKGVPKDREKAIQWYSMAAKQGIASAKTRLAQI
ncbi:hypothetical protein DFQ27_008071 [Actinomortierella ambigua]|uniref:Protein kinase domain-containing protein n=1 Tax=Actinomortierella ambigua TaxID=1343610 RepID=A0A9P6TYV8_9FUNG|nr:hypothetical protein DFQ27_008071 [Actinomortierella ambigua]